MPKRRLKLTIAYDGRPFAGWQSQPGRNTVQDHLRHAARQIHPDVSGVHGSGRTDAGVHALAQVAHFDVPGDSRMDASAWQRALNTHLPPAIRIMACTEVSSGFHAQFNALGKTYRYDLFAGPVLPPLLAGLTWHVRKPPDWDVLTASTKLFEGEHDFAAFAANRGDPHSNPNDTRRRISSIKLEKPAPDRLSLTFHGNGFLYKMVRLLTGGMVRCAQGGVSLEDLQDLLENPVAGKKSPLAAPPGGLYLVSVDY